VEIFRLQRKDLNLSKKWIRQGNHQWTTGCSRGVSEAVWSGSTTER